MNTLIKGTSERSMNNTCDMGGGGGMRYFEMIRDIRVRISN